MSRSSLFFFSVQDVVNKCGDWEKGHFFLAKYYEKVMNAYDDKSKMKIL